MSAAGGTSGPFGGGSGGPSVGVVGGGLAGITTALRCADAGCPVTLWEAAPRLGGRTFSFVRHGLDVDNGQHVFLRCCTAYRALLDRLGVADQVTLQPRLDISVRGPAPTRPARLRRTGRPGAPGASPRSLTLPHLPAPWHLAVALARYAPLSVAERLAFARAALTLRRVDPADPATDEQSFGAWLAAHGQSERAVGNLWDLVGVATLNATAAASSLALAATVFQVGLLTDAAAADLGWPEIPLSRLHADAARRQLDAAGALVLAGAAVEAIEARGGRWLVRSRRREQVVDRLVLAVGAAAAQCLLPPGAPTRPGGAPLPDGWAQRLGSSPIINAHAVFDRPVMTGPFLAGVGTPVQWVFDRTRASGLADGQYLAVSVSAAAELIETPTAGLRALLLPALASLLPAVRSARLRDFFVTRERHATFAPAPGSARLRPGPVTMLPGLFLAGAWTATGWPDTMESAVRSGETAARALLASGSRQDAGVQA